jgi:hypothetical protein
MADEPGISITPAIIKNLYKIGSAVGKADNNSQAVAEFEQEYFYPSDIPIFQKKFDLPLKNISRIVGRNQPNTGASEVFAATCVATGSLCTRVV